MDFLGLLLKASFHRAALKRYTGFKSSPYTEGALFYGEKLVDASATDAILAQAEHLAKPLQVVACEPGSA
jgi:hypothetical protein